MDFFPYDRDLFLRLKGARIFMTGGTGFFGCNILETIIRAERELNLGITVGILTRDPDRFLDQNSHFNVPFVHWIRGDVRHFHFHDERYDYVIHAATEASVALNADHPAVMLDTIIKGTERTLEFAKHCRAKRFLLTSSGAVYGKQPSDLTHISEDYTGAPDSTVPSSAYGEGKRLAELMTAIAGKGTHFETVIARCFAFSGPYLPLDTSFAMGNFIRDALRGKTIAVAGDGTPYRSYMDASDLVHWLFTLLLDGQNGRAYNVGSEDDLTIEELAQRIASLAPGVMVSVAQKKNPLVPVTRYVPSTERVRNELGLLLRISLDESIERMLNWHRQS